MRTPDFWSHRHVFTWLLLPFSWLYFVGMRLHRLICSRQDFDVPVWCIGNLVAGGGGKTPTVIALAQWLQQLGYTPHIISRGYGGHYQGVMRVDPTLHSAEDVGDEPLLLARTAPCWVSHHRPNAAKKAIAEGANILLLDDGMQNHTIKKDVQVLAVYGSYGFGNQWLLPAGPLREPLEGGLKRVDVAVIIGDDSKGVRDALLPHTITVKGKLEIDASSLSGQRVLAFAGIAHPERFFAAIDASGAELVHHVEFADHHPYSKQECQQLIHSADRHNAQLITTEKDYVRLPDELKEHTLPVPAKLVIAGLDELQSLLGKQ